MSLSTKFADQGTTVSVLTFDDERITPTLKPGVYSVGFSPFSGFYLSKKGPTLPVPDKIYGSVGRKMEKILASYQNATKSFGVLLSGEKGSGKTMTSSLVCNHCVTALDLPVILIESGFDGAGLSNFIEKLGECVLFIDEFGKKFRNDEGEQGTLLGLFDGTGSSKRLVLLTENEVRSINPYMLNRPGRVHYHFRHEKLDEDIVREYCADRELPEAVIEQICLRRETSGEFSFDVLQAIVTEYKHFGGDIASICDDLNIERPILYARQQMNILKILDLTADCERTVWKNEMPDFPTARENITVHITELDDPEDYNYAPVSVKHIVKKEGDVYLFATQCNGHDLVIYARSEEKQHHWNAL